MITRVVKLPNHANVLVGRDLDELFEAGHVYSVSKLLGEYIIEDIGLSSLADRDESCYPNKNSTVEPIMSDGKIYFTSEELKYGN